MCVCVCVRVFSSHSFWTSSSLDVPAGVTQEEGHTGFFIHLPSAVRALFFLARRIQPFLSPVGREVEFCVQQFSRSPLVGHFYFYLVRIFYFLFLVRKNSRPNNSKLMNSRTVTIDTSFRSTCRLLTYQGYVIFCVVEFVQLLLLCCFSHSAHWLPTRKKILYTVANPARGLLNRKKKKKSLVAPAPLPRALLVRRNKNKIK